MKKVCVLLALVLLLSLSSSAWAEEDGWVEVIRMDGMSVVVLGDNTKEDEYKFILDRPVKVKDIFNGNPDIDLPEKGYVIQHSAFRKLESYKQIGKDL